MMVRNARMDVEIENVTAEQVHWSCLNCFVYQRCLGTDVVTDVRIVLPTFHYTSLFDVHYRYVRVTTCARGGSVPGVGTFCVSSYPASKQGTPHCRKGDVF